MKSRNFSIGYHGTTEDRLSSILATNLKAGPSQTSWLGTGVYFFQDGPLHAKAWANWASKNREGRPAPIVIRANINLDNSIDLVDRRFWPEISALYKSKLDELSKYSQIGPRQISDVGIDLSKIGMNCVDFNLMNAYVSLKKSQMAKDGMMTTTIRAAFIEGKPIHPTSWLYKRSNIMLCVFEPSGISDVEIVKI